MYHSKKEKEAKINKYSNLKITNEVTVTKCLFINLKHFK